MGAGRVRERNVQTNEDVVCTCTTRCLGAYAGVARNHVRRYERTYLLVIPDVILGHLATSDTTTLLRNSYPFLMK
jgi:hypothetical protein